MKVWKNNFLGPENDNLRNLIENVKNNNEKYGIHTNDTILRQ
jgi:hypothetical protein